MKKILITFCACMATALCAWAAWPEQKSGTHDHHLCAESEHICGETDVEPATGGGTWVKVSDNCGKCKMNDTDRVCGKCGGFMAGVNGTQSYDNGYIKSDYKCKKCGHTITYKNKW